MQYSAPFFVLSVAMQYSAPFFVLSVAMQYSAPFFVLSVAVHYSGYSANCCSGLFDRPLCDNVKLFLRFYCLFTNSVV
jgi:hypothetical protein